MSKIRFGVIGCGLMATGAHIPELYSRKDSRIVAFADKETKKLKLLAKQYKIDKIYTDYRDLVKRPDIDAVVVATPLNNHYIITRQALLAGKHVLCEKPFTECSKEGNELTLLAKQKKKILAVNFNLRLGIERKIKKLIDNGTVGKIKVIRCIYNWHMHQWKYKDRLKVSMANGGPVIDSGCHFFDLIRWYSKSKFEYIDAVGVYVKEFKNPVHVITNLRMSNKIIGLIEVGWIYGYNSKDEAYLRITEVIGSEGIIRSSWIYHPGEPVEYVQFRILNKKETISQRIKLNEKSLRDTYNFFIQSIKEKKVIKIASGKDAVLATEAAKIALKSALSKK